jgi:hypothetical protein
MTRRPAFVLATTAAIAAALPQMAHASCSGDACSAYGYLDGKFTNRDTARQIRLTGCYLSPYGACNASFDMTVDASKTKAVNPPSGARVDALGKPNPKVDVKTATFIGSPPAAAPAAIPRLKSAADMEKEIDQTRDDLARLDAELDKVTSKSKLDELNSRASKDRETINRIDTVLNGSHSVIETNPQDWSTLKQKTSDAGAKAAAVQKRILGCVLAGDVTGGDAPGGNTPPPTNIDQNTKGKHVGGCKREF